MPEADDLAALRDRIAGLSSAPPGPAPAVALGAPDLDARLPDGGLAAGALHEIVPDGHGDRVAAAGFAAGLLARAGLARAGPMLWAIAHDPAAPGALYPPGLAAFGVDPGRIVHLRAGKPRDLLWALEESLTSPALAGVACCLPARSASYDFTASRRLAMRAAESGVPAFLIRSGSGATATAAATRWTVATRPSAPVREGSGAMPAPGAPRWHVALTRCRRSRPHGWLVEWDHETLSFRLAAPLAYRAPAANVTGRDSWSVAS